MAEFGATPHSRDTSRLPLWALHLGEASRYPTAFLKERVLLVRRPSCSIDNSGGACVGRLYETRPSRVR